MVGHITAIWLGAVLASATAASGARVIVLRRLGPLAVGAELALSGVVAAHRANLRSCTV